MLKRNSAFLTGVPKDKSKEEKKKSSFYDDYLKKANQNKQEAMSTIKKPVLTLPDSSLQSTQTNSSNSESLGSVIKKNIKSVLSQKYGELDTRHIFDDIDDMDVEDNISTAENTIKTNIDKGFLNKDAVSKLPNLRDGLALSYAAAENGNSKAATRAREAAYTEQKTTNEFNKLISKLSENKPSNQTSKSLDFYNDYIEKVKSSPNHTISAYKFHKPMFSPEVSDKPRYVNATILNMRNAPGTNSKVVGKLTNGTEVKYTGNKTSEIDGHLWAEVKYDGKTGWVAADYLKTAKPQSSNSNIVQNDSFEVSTSSQKTAPSVNVDYVNKERKINFNDHAALQTAFSKVRKPGATSDDIGEPGDFDGFYGLQCVDITKWFVTNFTTLKSVSGDGKNQVSNLAQENSLHYTTIPCAPAIFSVDGSKSGPGTSGLNDDNCGHTGVILSCELTDKGEYRLTYFHAYNGLLKDGKTSAITTKTFTPEQLKNTTFLDLKNYMIKNK